ncbi:MAG: TIGR01841 family phasin [Zoogloeaceae bacterium]|jgi:phasin family protein|nr:TIGR01841 family phasin [Zoogloeaceae bacterium]
MSLSPEQFSAANKAVVDSLLSLSNTALASAERFAALNLNTARSVFEDSVSGTKALLDAKTPQEAFSQQAAQVQPNVEKAVAYTRSVYEIAAQAKDDLSKQIEGQYAEFQKSLTSLIDQSTKNLPIGSDVAVAAVKSALNATNSAFDSLNKAARQASEIAEANIAAATNATVKAVNATTEPSKKK